MITIFKQLYRRHRRALMLLTCITLVSGCAMVAPSKPPVTVGDIIQMSKENVPTETIINKMRDSNSVYPLTATQLSELHDMGVADRGSRLYAADLYRGAAARAKLRRLEWCDVATPCLVKATLWIDGVGDIYYEIRNHDQTETVVAVRER